MGGAQLDLNWVCPCPTAVSGWRPDHRSLLGDEDPRPLRHPEGASSSSCCSGESSGESSDVTCILDPAGVPLHVCGRADQSGAVHEERPSGRQRCLDDI